MTFGDDPWDFNDPTIYEIKEVTPDMSDEEKKKIYSVADYPHNDLAELIPGDPPDMDFSNQKPPNQVQASTFNTYVEAYLRPFTEEDLAFLRDRGDRTTPFTIPRRGKKHYTEIWAEEDGLMTAEQARERQNRLPENQPRGSLEDLDENIAETDAVSTGPLASRVLSLLRPEHRQPPSDPATTNGTNENADLDSLLGTDSMTVDPPAAPLPSATYMPDSATEGWKKNMTHPQLDHHQIDERLKQELRHLGFMPMDEEPDYDAAEDDEIAARMRVLQERLRVVSMQNGAKKRLLMDMTKERMAYQEYATIREDLDTQVQTNFTKRNRTIGKKTKAKRPGGAGGGSHTAQGMARPGIGEPTKLLMEKRKKWIDAVGPVFSDDMGRVPRSSDPDSSIFKEEVMAQHLKAEKESWDEEADEE
jgi:transcriptional adapter 3